MTNVVRLKRQRRVALLERRLKLRASSAVEFTKHSRDPLGGDLTIL